MPITASDFQAETRPRRADQTVKLPSHVRHRLRLSAVYLDREISELVEVAVLDYLDRLDRERQERGLPPLPRPDC